MSSLKAMLIFLAGVSFASLMQFIFLQSFLTATPEATREIDITKTIISGSKTGDASQGSGFMSLNSSSLHFFDSDQKPLFPPTHPVCQALPTPSPNALAMWMNYIKRIHLASELKPNENGRYYFHDYFAQLLALITPRLPHSIQNMPSDYKVIRRILDKMYERWTHLLHGTNDHATEPVKVVILGGSVLVGRNCRKLVRDLNIQGIRMPQRDCNFAHRLENFVGQLFHPDLIQVTNVGMGGTNSAVGAQIFEYDLLPEEAKNPDIVINAYSTNDMHVLTMMEAQASNITIRDHVFNITQNFVRAVKSRSCTHPLLLHFDDYLGNEQREILTTTQLAQGVHVLADYYGFGSLSYANVVRPWVYGDTKEFWFSPEGWYENNQMAREIHPGMGMHIISTWILSFAFLHMVTTFCSIETLVHSTGQDYSSSPLSEHIPLKGWYSEIPGKPSLPYPEYLPPSLTTALSLEHISDEWRKQDDSRSKCEARQCPFSWLSGVSKEHSDQVWVTEYFKTAQQSSSEWKLSGDGNKLGWVPPKQSSSMILKVPSPSMDASNELKVATVFYLKSYGEKWHQSVSKLEILDDDGSGITGGRVLGEMELRGQHNKQTSEVYSESLKFSASGSVLVRLTLMGGTTFKLMGLVVCT